ncbi:kinesin-like protein KIN-14F isoform X1 [Macadamia integrifolia]|uniref:kinesin-like protein KIN-14F isoform X1 n=1 Tax=Macadamia integrifolia TaxID=60698 RepID=UPI001C52D944|nr:kinesin-like protein KIN-14F isoform X1 [Macadamia integrifolia]
MPREANCISMFTSPCKNLRPGLKGLNSEDANIADEVINDDELAQRKAGEAALRRSQAAEWLRQMDQGASETLPRQPSEEEFCHELRNGLILCNVLNKVNPGAIPKVVESPVITVQSADGGAQSAIQYFENMRNFLVAVGEMKLLTFEASDLEKGGSSGKVVDCILCLKGYHEWKLAGGIGVWRYGGTVRITSLPKGSPSSLINGGGADESSDGSESGTHDQQLLEYLHLSSKISLEESEEADALAFLFDRFGLELLRAYLTEWNGIRDLPLNAMLIDTVLKKVVEDFTKLFVSQSNQLGLLLKKILNAKNSSVSKEDFREAISRYLLQRTGGISSDFSRFCICGGKLGKAPINNVNNTSHVERLDLQQKQLEELKSVFQRTKLEVEEDQLNWEDDLKRLEHHINGLEVASSSYHKLLEENRMLYNQVQDLKGSIRVYCRVRPFLPGQSTGQSTVEYIGENGNIMIVNPHKQGKDARKVFSFNKVFGTDATQQQVFADTQPLIKSVLDGFNVCIFAYGQTGSGKTYTMSGPDLTTEETWGVNYRALSDLFQLSNARMDIIEYEVSVQMIEIYNEQVRDLLVVDGSNRRLDIRNNSQLNGLNVPDASLIPVNCTQNVLELMKIGQRNRAVGATALNERSSRSHSVLTVHVQGKELTSGSILRGCLHLVDLAGSERVNKSEAVGERLKEAQHINKSLSALGDVISSLAQKSTHIPYRNSKLTQVLQDALGGQAKTLMFVHINPEVNAIGETISTLKFAERVASIELGAARANKETGEIRELKEEVANLKLALERKEAELEQMKVGNSRIGMEPQKLRTASPLRVPRNGISASLKPEISQRPVDETRSFEARSCSSGKQRKSRFPSAFPDKDPIPKMFFHREESPINSGKPRSPSPPVRRSLSTDRGALMRSRIKQDTLDSQPTVKLQFPARVAVNKSVAAMPVIPSDVSNSRGFWGPQEPLKQDNITDAIYSLHRASLRKVHLEHQEEQLKQALNVRQGGIRKSKPEPKAKIKHQLPGSTQKSDAALTLISEMDTGGKLEEAQKTDFSEPENENGITALPANGSWRMKRLQQLSRNSQNLEPRALVQAGESLLMGKHENKQPAGVICNGKEGTNNSMPAFRRSLSSPHGKFTSLP